MKKLSLFSALMLFIFLASCTKEPTANFEYLNSSTVYVGEKVFLINYSSDADSYDWSFGDGHTSSSESPDHTYYSPGSFTISLTANNGSKSDTYTQSINVKDPKGKIIFWSDFQGPPINVYWRSSYKGQITAVLSSAPSCGESGCVNISNLNPGTYSYTAEETSSPNRTWSGHATIEAGTCLRLNLTSSKNGKPIAKSEKGVCGEKNTSKIIGSKTE